MDAKDLLPVIFERANSAQIFWNIMLALIAAIATFIAAARKVSQKLSAKMLATIVYFVVAIPNCEALVRIARERNTLIDIFPSLKFDPPGLTEALVKAAKLSAPDETKVIIAYHLLIAAVIITLIWGDLIGAMLRAIGKPATNGASSSPASASTSPPVSSRDAPQA